MSFYLNFVLPGVLFLGMTLFGFWLSIIGKPYNTAIFTIHKILALAFVVLSIIKLLPYLKESSISGMLLLLLIVAVMCISGLFATGAAMSILENSNKILLWIHRILPIGIAGALIGILELLKTNTQ